MPNYYTDDDGYVRHTYTDKEISYRSGVIADGLPPSNPDATPEWADDECEHSQCGCCCSCCNDYCDVCKGLDADVKRYCPMGGGG